MHISPEGIKLITRWEGYHRKLKDGRCTTYYCPANVLTIGYGCTHGIKKGMVWTHAEAVRGLRRELDDVERDVNKYVAVDLEQAEYDALVSFTYNCGPGALRKSTLLKRLNAGDKEGARRQLSRWRRGGGRVLKGLVRRRADEMAHWLRDIQIYDPQEVEIMVPDKKPSSKSKPSELSFPTGDIIGDLEAVENPAEPTEDPMPQQVDEPEDARKALKKSRKWNIIQWFRGIFGFTSLGGASYLSASSLTEASGYMGAVMGFVESYGLVALVAVVLGGWMAAEVLAKYQVDDVEDGRYDPSGEDFI